MDFIYFLRSALLSLAASAYLLLAACTGGVQSSTAKKSAALENIEESDVLPKLVLQVGHQFPVEAVAWANEDKNLISLDMSGTIVVWDVESGAVVNRSHLPVNWVDEKLGGYHDTREFFLCVYLKEFSLEGNTFSVTYAADPDKFADVEELQTSSCAGIFASNDSGYIDDLHFAFDVTSWESVEPPAPTPAPAASGTLEVGGAVHMAETSLASQDRRIIGAYCGDAAPALLVHEDDGWPTFSIDPLAQSPGKRREALLGTCGGAVRKSGKQDRWLENDVIDPEDFDRSEFFPLSSNKRYAPRPNFDNGVPGYAALHFFGNGTSDIFYDLEMRDRGTCLTIDRCRAGINLYKADGGVISLTGNVPSYFLDADISADGLKLARVAESSAKLEREDEPASPTLVEVLNLEDGTGWEAYRPSRPYHHVGWLDSEKFILSSDGSWTRGAMLDTYSNLGEEELAKGGYWYDHNWDIIAPTQLVDQQCARSNSCRTLERYSGTVSLGERGGFLGISRLIGCSRNRDAASGDPESWMLRCNWGAWFDEKGRLVPDRATSAFADRPFASRLSFHPVPAAGDPGSWRRIAVPGLRQGEVVTALERSSDGETLAIATQSLRDRFPDNPDLEIYFKQTARVLTFKLASGGRLSSPRELFRFDADITEGWEGQKFAFEPGRAINALQFTPDGKRIVFNTDLGLNFAEDPKLFVLDAASTKTARIKVRSTSDERTHVSDLIYTSSDDEDLNTYPIESYMVTVIGNDRAFDLANRTLVDLSSGETLKDKMTDANLVRAGYVEASNMLWAASDDGTIHFWDAEDGADLLTLYTFPDNRFFAVMPGGRYDTNLPPDSNLIRWVVSDKPWQSLAPQTFMRDYYEPGLYRKLIECRKEDATCTTPFAKTLRPISKLNRELPSVAIIEISAARGDPTTALVTVEAQSVDSEDGKTSSGIYNLRLFRNGRLVDSTPSAPDKFVDPKEAWDKTVADWQQLNRVTGKKVYRKTFTVALPTDAESRDQVFSAYAFNEDRIKGETASMGYKRPAVAPRPRKAYVLNIGIDAYDLPVWRLRFSVGDARLMGERLSRIPGYEVHRVALLGEELPGQAKSRVDPETITRALDRIVNLATPDDLIIVTYAGHGVADEYGNFYLVPTNASADKDWKPPKNATAEAKKKMKPPPDPASLYSSFMLSNIMRRSKAGEIALIIDACQSAASVEGAGFKPGPMGDSGLGQLAYDKGILILAASQADNVAKEDKNLKHGLLTFALAANGEGLDETGGKADLDGDRNIRLDEWLSYGVVRMPSLFEDRELKSYDPESGEFRDLARGDAKRYVQKPTLFDFNSGPSTVVLREGLR